VAGAGAAERSVSLRAEPMSADASSVVGAASPGCAATAGSASRAWVLICGRGGVAVGRDKPSFSQSSSGSMPNRSA
jgi:hypothetical protein